MKTKNSTHDRRIIFVHAEPGNAHALAATIAKNIGETVLVQARPADLIVNGVGYYEIPKPTRSGNISRLTALLFALSSFDSSTTARSRELPRGTNVVEEYGKIQLKKSRLSKWERDRVTSIFESSFCRIEE